MMRPYEPQDLDWVVETADKAWRGINASYRQALGDELFGHLFPSHGTRKGTEMRALCAEQPDRVWICEEGGRRVGFVFALLDIERGIGEIGNNAVDPDCGLKGIGQQMYRFVLEWFRSQGMRYAKVSTGLDEGHGRARRAYERAGFDRSLPSITYYRTLEGGAEKEKP
jgi:GNAT superfamily N-acetyltransferase